MRLPRVRITVRRMMVAVAIVALGLAVVRWMRSMDALSANYHHRALSHYVKLSNDHFLMLQLPDDPRDDKWLDRRKTYRRAMAEKWNRAALFPWLPIEPDPPEPE